MKKLCNAMVVLMLLLASNASADTLRFASGYPSTSQVDGRPYVGSEVVVDFSRSWGIVGMPLSIDQRVRIDSVVGVGGYVGDQEPTIATPYVAIFSSTEAFRTSNLSGDIFNSRMTFSSVEEFSSESIPIVDNFLISLNPSVPLMLAPGDYVIAVWLELPADNWGWVYSTADLGTDYLVTSANSNITELDNLSDTGTVAVDIFGTPIPDGDYDFDGDVDGADYLKWQSTYGSTTDLDADGNGDNVVDAADYTVWRDNYSSPALTATASAIVPEPSGVFLAATCFALLSSSRIRRRKELLR